MGRSGVRGAGEARTSPRALMAQDSRSSAEISSTAVTFSKERTPRSAHPSSLHERGCPLVPTDAAGVSLVMDSTMRRAPSVHARGRLTSPLVLMAQDSPSSAAAAAAESDARFASAAADAASAVAAIGLVEDGADAGSAAMAGCCAVASRGTAAAAAAVAGDGGFDAAGRRRWRTSLALGPAAGTRSSASRWRMRSALICGKTRGGGRRGCSW
jgi:hypothetical protein